MMHIGFTGTRKGMTPEQRLMVVLLVERFTTEDLAITGHHGDCIGADAEFHEIIRAFPFGRVVGHIPVDDSDRAFCTFDEERAPLPYMRRNREIVRASQVIIAAPAARPSFGGTWKTIGIARRHRSPLAIAFPDGSVAWEREPGTTEAT